jgi:hypothetical protein
MMHSGRALDPRDANYWRLSTILARKFHGPIKLYADKESADVLLNDWKLEFDEIDMEVIERDTSGAHPMCWSVGKLAAIRDMAIKGEPFFHIDGDAFLFRPLPNNIQDAPIFCQCIERAIPKSSNVYLSTSYYPINELLPNLKMPYWMQAYSRLSHQKVMNMGFFGGNDFDTIKEFCDVALKVFVGSRHNNQAFQYLQRGKPHFLGIAAIAEQWSLASYLHWKRIEPVTMMDSVNSYDLSTVKQQGWGHIYSLVRYRPEYLSFVSDELESLLSEENVERMREAA